MTRMTTRVMMTMRLFLGIHSALIVCFTLQSCLAAPHQIFLSLRVIEFREQGYNDADAVKLGFAHTAGTITTAGVIMAIAFGSLMLSSQMLLVEAGFYIAVSILFDTFIVRTIIVPCVMVVLGPVNWWPRVMPPVSRSIADGVFAPADFASEQRPL